MALDNYEDLNVFLTAKMLAVGEKTAIDINLYVQELRLAGLTDDAIEILLMADLTEGGFIFGSYANQVTGTVKDSVNMLGKTSSMDVYRQAGIEEWQWIVVNGSNACPDCQPREGRTEEMELWYEIGTPASGWSVCRSHCACVLVPVEYDGKKSFDKKVK